MQEYGVGGGKADLLKVLESCTKELLKYPRYTNDIRFLRIWIQYVRLRGARLGKYVRKTGCHRTSYTAFYPQPLHN
jgi:hypothetical protein